jgi:hypothetical protein
LNLENIPLPHNNKNKQPGEDILIPGENSQNRESPGSTGLLHVYDLVSLGRSVPVIFSSMIEPCFVIDIHERGSIAKDKVMYFLEGCFMWYEHHPNDSG